jgi:hypothetical protein
MEGVEVGDVVMQPATSASSQSQPSRCSAAAAIAAQGEEPTRFAEFAIDPELQPAPSKAYHLRAVVLHLGASPEDGHYVW